MAKQGNADAGLSRREVMRTGAGALLGATAVLAGAGEVAKLAAQGAGPQPTPLPPTDPRYPMPPTWNRELRQLAMDAVRWYEEWDGTLTPDYNAAAVREATIEYNEVKAGKKQASEMIPLSRMEASAHGC